MHTIIAYLIGNIKYKRLLLNQYSNRYDAIKVYRENLNKYINDSQFVMVMLDDDHNILTCWALQTPPKLKEVQEMALNTYEETGELYIDPRLTLENILGSQILEEIVREAKDRERSEIGNPSSFEFLTKTDH